MRLFTLQLLYQGLHQVWCGTPMASPGPDFLGGREAQTTALHYHDSGSSRSFSKAGSQRQCIRLQSRTSISHGESLGVYEAGSTFS